MVKVRISILMKVMFSYAMIVSLDIFLIGFYVQAGE